MALLCPQCRIPMAVYEESGAALDICHSCRGLWFDPGALRRIEDTPLELTLSRGAEAALRIRYCPRCTQSRLETMEVRGAEGLVLDQCDRCQGMFLEAGKLQRVGRLKAYRARRARAEEARLLGTIAEERRKRDSLAKPGGGIEIESASTSGGNLLTVLLNLPREEYSATEKRPYAVYALAMLIVAVWLWQLSVPETVWLALAAVPADILAGKHLYTLVTAVFLHGGLLHIIGNLYFFMVFADNVEDRVGHLQFLGWYLVWGVTSAIIYAAMCAPADRAIPSLGASGAISGAMGAYVVLFPRNRIVARLFGFLAWGVVIKLPAWTYLGFWMALQLMYVASGEPGVGWWAHIGGFFVGAAVGAGYRSRAGQSP